MVKDLEVFCAMPNCYRRFPVLGMFQGACQSTDKACRWNFVSGSNGKKGHISLGYLEVV